MNPWNTYRSRINAHGITKRDSVLQRERAFFKREASCKPFVPSIDRKRNCTQYGCH